MTAPQDEAPPGGAHPLVRVRYGVFLTPDAATCAAVTAVTAFVRARFGFVSAGAFPPHATLLGSLPIAAAEAVLVEALDAVLSAAVAVPVQNIGVRRLGDVVVYDVFRFDGSPNTRLLELAQDLDAAVRPLVVPSAGLAPDLVDPGRFSPHLSLASHELLRRPELTDEVAAFARDLPVPVPAAFAGNAVTLYRFRHPTWSGPRWLDMTWEHVRSWRLGDPGPEVRRVG